ncbi:MAG TPA: FtsX-like permease family protein [Gemmataceae bacterium]|nr:FtsX-like permease family protein [Gemmataceae bacterium]
MAALLRTLSLRYLRKHALRTVLVVASIALGVATLVATRVLNQSMVQAARGAATPLADMTGLLVTNGEAGVDRALIDELRRARLPGVRTVRPLIIDRAVLPALNNKSAMLVGVELDSLNHNDNPWGIEVQLVARPLAIPRGYPVFVGSRLAAAMPDGIAEFQVRVAGKIYPLSGYGTVDAHDTKAILGGSVLFMSLDDAARLSRLTDRVTRIDLTLEPEANREQVQRQAQEIVGNRAEVRSPEVNDQSMHKVMAGLELGFQLGGLCALVVGLLLVYNALSVSVAERRHDIGILRSLGATRGQVAGLFMGEAGLLGLAGSLLGVPLGLGLAHLALGPFQQILSDVFVPLQARRVEVTADTLVLAVVAGAATAMLAGLVPATRAAGEEPADAVRRVPRLHGTLARLLPVLSSALLVGAGLACFALRRQLPERIGTYGAILLVFLGALVITASLAAVVARLLLPLVRLLLGVEERLAADNLIRSPGRTGLVIASLAAFVALMMQTAGVTQSSEDAVLTWVDHSIAADLFVTANSPVTASGQSLAMQESVGRQLETLLEVEKAVPVRFKQVEFRDDRVFLIALDAGAFYSADLLPAPVPGLELLPRLSKSGAVLVSENFALLHGVGAGESITLRGPGGPVQLHVLGTVQDYSWNRGTVVIDREHYLEHFRDDLVDVFDLYIRPPEAQIRIKLSAALGAASGAPFPVNLPWGLLCQSPQVQDPNAVRETILRRWGVEESLVVMTRPELRESIRGMIQRLYGIGYAQEAVVGMVAAIGVVTSLLISVLQRRRELGLLRALGASRGQVLRSVLAEAVLMGLIGAVSGLLIGIPMEYYAVRVILLEEAGFSFGVRVPWQVAGGVIGLATLIATLAGLLPAWHAVRLRIADAIAYE